MKEDNAIRMTETGRKVFHLAEKEALVLGHEYVGTEHILFGLCKEGKGLAANVLHGMGLNPELLYRALRVAFPYRSEKQLSKPLPISPRANSSIVKAKEVADLLEHRYVGTEHLLLGILLPENFAGELLTCLGVDVNQIRHEVFQIRGYDDPRLTGTDQQS